MPSVPASRSISPTISSAYFFSAKITSEPAKAAYTTSFFEIITLTLCALGKLTWRDDSGHCETDLAGCFSQPTSEFNWQFYGDHNVEHKLK